MKIPRFCHKGTDMIVCPHCGMEYGYPFFSLKNIVCKECERAFSVSVRQLFTTKKRGRGDVNMVMKNRPDKPGWWWWEDVYGDANASKFEHLYTVKDTVWSINEFEGEEKFRKWLGQAHPPKRLRLLSRVDVIKDHEYTGLYARRADVEEFILEEE